MSSRLEAAVFTRKDQEATLKCTMFALQGNGTRGNHEKMWIWLRINLMQPLDQPVRSCRGEVEKEGLLSQLPQGWDVPGTQREEMQLTLTVKQGVKKQETKA